MATGAKERATLTEDTDYTEEKRGRGREGKRRREIKNKWLVLGEEGRGLEEADGGREWGNREGREMIRESEVQERWGEEKRGEGKGERRGSREGITIYL